VLLCTFASCVYIALGDRVTTVITKELPHDTVSVGTVTTQLAYSLALVLSYPLQLFPVTLTLEQYLIPYSSKDRPAVKWYKNAFRTGLVLATVTISIKCASNLNAFVSIIGSVCCIPLHFIYAPLMHLQVAKGGWKRGGDYLLMAVGCVLSVLCTYLSIISWVNVPDDDATCPLAGRFDLAENPGIV
jgi:proton-coupled amino acid transporter